jgi:L-ascorbate metabolism protein UlaG (beta-lactamase superfamily)
MSVKIIWYGHATIGLEIAGMQLLIDPYFTGNPAVTVKPEDVPADYILVTHGHGDHIRDAAAIAMRTGAMVITTPELSTWLKQKGVTRFHEQHIGGGFNYPFGYVKLTLALHGSNLPDGTNGGNPVGFLITTVDGKKIYLAGDTGLFGDMRLIGEEGLDLAMLPIGDNYTMGPADALRAVKLLQPRHVIPIHYSTFELLKQDAPAWARQVEAETETKVHVLQPGGTFELAD